MFFGTSFVGFLYLAHFGLSAAFAAEVQKMDRAYAAARSISGHTLVIGRLDRPGWDARRRNIVRAFDPSGSELSHLAFGSLSYNLDQSKSMRLEDLIYDHNTNRFFALIYMDYGGLLSLFCFRPDGTLDPEFGRKSHPGQSILATEGETLFSTSENQYWLRSEARQHALIAASHEDGTVSVFIPVQPNKFGTRGPRRRDARFLWFQVGARDGVPKTVRGREVFLRETSSDALAATVNVASGEVFFLQSLFPASKNKSLLVTRSTWSTGDQGALEMRSFEHSHAGAAANPNLIPTAYMVITSADGTAVQETVGTESPQFWLDLFNRAGEVTAGSTSQYGKGASQFELPLDKSTGGTAWYFDYDHRVTTFKSIHGGMLGSEEAYSLGAAVPRPARPAGVLSVADACTRHLKGKPPVRLAQPDYVYK